MSNQKEHTENGNDYIFHECDLICDRCDYGKIEIIPNKKRICELPCSGRERKDNKFGVFKLKN